MPQKSPTPTDEAIIQRLHALANPANVRGMARFGINPKDALGISVEALRKLAKEAGKNHALATQLWDSGIHEARILAALVDLPQEVTEAQMEGWAVGA